jgi:hypothetical protein
MMTDEETVVSAVEQAQKPKDNLVTLSTGVVLRGKQANPLVLIDVMAAYPRPKPPVWKHPTMGREMENTDDPDYRNRVKAWEAESSSATLNAMILLGTELVKIPKGMPGPDEAEWLDEYELLNLPMHPANKSWRYLKWVLFKAVRDEKDLMRIRDVVGRLSGVSERAVESAESFPGSE